MLNPEKRDRRSIYVAHTPDGRVKIGTAFNARRRVASIRTASPVDVSLAFRTDFPAARADEVEARAHALLKRQHVRGEWFLLSVEEAIAAITTAAAELNVEAMAEPVLPKRDFRPKEPKQLVLFCRNGNPAFWFPQRNIDKVAPPAKQVAAGEGPLHIRLPIDLVTALDGLRFMEWPVSRPKMIQRLVMKKRVLMGLQHGEFVSLTEAAKVAGVTVQAVSAWCADFDWKAARWKRVEQIWKAAEK